MSPESSTSPVIRGDARDGVLGVRRPETEWLSTGHDSGRSRGDHAYVVSVPEGFARTDLPAYVCERLDAAGFDDEGPALLTGVSVADARVARAGPAAVIATVGLSNPAALFPDGEGGEAFTRDGDEVGRPTGTVNLVAVVDRALAPGALANLIAVAAEAKAATLDRLAGVPGTTSDAVVVGCDPGGEPAAFSGSATEIGAAVRACVRDAVTAGFRARYDDQDPPASVADAEHGVVTDLEAEVSPL